MWGNSRSRIGEPLVVEAGQLHQLLNRDDCFKKTLDGKEFKVLRFLMKTDGSLVFAAEGGPGKHIPAHWQMTGESTPVDAGCITAGNAYFDADNNLCCFNNQSGDFRPEFDSLQFVIPKFVEANIPFKDTVQIQRASRSGLIEESYDVEKEELLHFKIAKLLEDIEIIEDSGFLERISSEHEAVVPNNDLAVLKQFIAHKLALNANNQFGDEFSDSINRFHEKAIPICTSDKSVKEKSAQLTALAHEEFQHRHSTRRLIADILMVGSSFFGVGLVVGLGRFASGRSLFFSNAATRREKDLTKMMQPESDLSGQLFCDF